MDPALEPFMGKKYRLRSSEKFDEYLKFIGVGMISRKLACSVSPVNSLTRDGDVYTFTMTTTLRTIKFSFKLGEEFEEIRPDGAKMKALMVVADSKLVQTQVVDGLKSTHVRTFTPDMLTVETTAEGWDDKCVRVYDAVA